MFRLIPRSRLLLAGAAATAALGAVGGTALATHGSASPTAATVNTTPVAAATATPSPAARARDHRFERELGRVTAVSATQISIADHTGKVHILRVGDRTRVLGPDGKPEKLTEVPTGELVIVTEAAPRPDPAASPSTPASAPGDAHTALVIRDTGFKAAG